MDAVRLIIATRQALAQARTAVEVVTEAWQAQAIAQAIGWHLAANGPPELRAEARALGEAGGALRRPGRCAAVARAARLTAVDEPLRVLRGLGGLLAEVGIALVGVACAAAEEALYWQCMEAIDAADESGDRVRRLVMQAEAWERRCRSGSARAAVRPALEPG